MSTTKKILGLMATAVTLFAAEDIESLQPTEAQVVYSSKPKASTQKGAPAPFQSGMPLEEGQSMPAFLQSARFETQNAWSYRFNIAYNEYYACQDGMEVAITSSTADGFYAGNFEPAGQVVNLDNSYHAGFKLGFSVDTSYDKWVLGTEYTWFRGHSDVSETATGTTYYQSPFWNINGLGSDLKAVNAEWKLGLDIADLYVSRPFYAGRKWTVDPVFGLRGGSIRQYFHLQGVFLGGSGIQQLSLKSNGWMFGPRAGIRSNWLLGFGFSMFGNLAATVPFTHYTTISMKNVNSAGLRSLGSNDGLNGIRPIVESGIGFKWGSYFGCQNSYYFDASFTYNFFVYFSQNVISQLSGMSLPVAGISPGNLYLHGVSIESSVLF